jgi:hypothetical protein
MLFHSLGKVSCIKQSLCGATAVNNVDQREQPIYSQGWNRMSYEGNKGKAAGA